MRYILKEEVSSLANIDEIHNINEVLIQNNYFNIGNQSICSESDLKCHVFHKLLNIIWADVKSELSDRIPLNYLHCGNLVVDGDLPDPNDNELVTRQPDITISFNSTTELEVNNGIQKHCTVNGEHIDIELKLLKGGYSSNMASSMRRDFCKLHGLCNLGTGLNNDIHGVTFHGIVIFAFQSEAIFNRYMEDEQFVTSLENYNNTVNLSSFILLLDEEENNGGLL
ncbi:MAG: hypothetical protein GQ570_10835 [Helicobacteraceae bacterium]|nr:hypothetical protein [Helicobacteraceae bacterium]